MRKIIVKLEERWLALTSPRELSIGKRKLILHTDNRHEIAYYRYLTRGSYLPSVEMDLQVAKRVIKEGAAVLDIGANVGFNTLFYADYGAGCVEAFEPTPVLYDRIRVHSDQIIHIHPIALSSMPGEMELFLPDEGHQGSTLDQNTAQDPEIFGTRPRAVRVTVDTIDRLFPARQFDFIKIDIEGHELDALRGAFRMLSERPPAYLQTECYDRKFPDLHDFLRTFFPVAVRLAVRPSNRELVFLRVDEQTGVHHDLSMNPPTYLYARSKDLAFWMK